MTILLIFGGWSLVITIMIKFFQYVHDCDEEIKKIAEDKGSLLGKAT